MLEIIKSRKNEEIKLAAKLVDSASFRREKRYVCGRRSKTVQRCRTEQY